MFYGDLFEPLKQFRLNVKIMHLTHLYIVSESSHLPLTCPGGSLTALSELIHEGVMFPYDINMFMPECFAGAHATQRTNVQLARMDQ